MQLWGSVELGSTGSRPPCSLWSRLHQANAVPARGRHAEGQNREPGNEPAQLRWDRGPDHQCGGHCSQQAWPGQWTPPRRRMKPPARPPPRSEISRNTEHLHGVRLGVRTLNPREKAGGAPHTGPAPTPRARADTQATTLRASTGVTDTPSAVRPGTGGRKRLQVVHRVRAGRRTHPNSATEQPAPGHTTEDGASADLPPKRT